MTNNLTPIQIETLNEMNAGKYLIKIGKVEGVTFNANLEAITNMVKAGTINALLEAGMIRQSMSKSRKYLLTNKGREYRRID